MAIFNVAFKEIKRRKRMIALLSCTVLLFGCMTVGESAGQTQEVYANQTLNMYSGSYALTDGDSGRVLAGKNETDPMANASTTKILTCIITLENCNLDEIVTISSNAASQPKVRLGMGAGEQYPLKDMLYGLMLESYNDCAVAIAEHVAGSVEEFAVLMNEKAKEIGCKDTYFITPNGLDEEINGEFHHSTAADLCRIMAYCVWESPMKEMFLNITQTDNYTGNANGNTYSFTNHNAFLDQMDGVLSGKTGFTAKAGYCYVAAMEQDGERYCIALLACGWPNNKTYKWHDARTLFTYGLENYDIREVTIKGISKQFSIDGYLDQPEMKQLHQENSLKIMSQDRRYNVLLGAEEQLHQEIVMYTNLKLPVEDGAVLGMCNVYLDELLIDQIPLCAEVGADTWSIDKICKLIFRQFLTFSS